jgi:hypothetical protein
MVDEGMIMASVNEAGFRFRGLGKKVQPKLPG